MKKYIIYLLIVSFCFADTLTLKPVKSDTQTNLSFNPEMVRLAGQSLKKSQSYFFTGLGLSVLGSLLYIKGTQTTPQQNNSTKDLYKTGGLICMAIGFIGQIVTFIKIGDAGNQLIEATE